MKKFIISSILGLSMMANAAQVVSWQVQENSDKCTQVPFIYEGVNKVAVTCPAILVYASAPDTTLKNAKSDSTSKAKK